MGKVYAVRVGRKPGIYDSWSEVQPLVNGFPGAQHKSFTSRYDAEAYLAAGLAPAPAARAGTKRSRPDNDFNGADGADDVAAFQSVRRGPPAQLPKRADPIAEFDGAARGNPGQAGCGAVLRYNGSVICRLRKYLGARNTNNEAEYTALIEGLKMALRLGVSRLHAKGDSKLVVQQVSGRWAINKDHLRELCTQVHEHSRGFAEFNITHIPREWNADADKLSNDAIDLAYR